MSTKIYLFLKQHNNLLDNKLKDFLNIALLQLNREEYLELLSVLITCKIDLSEFYTQEQLQFLFSDESE